MGTGLQLSTTIFEAAIVACKSSLGAAGMKVYDREIVLSNSIKRRYLKATWDLGTDEDNLKNFGIAHQILFEHMQGYIYMTVVDSKSFAVAIKEVDFTGEYDPGM